jgi:hypothetical protein
MKELNLFLYIILLIALVIPIYQVYRYGFSGYYQKKTEKRQRRNQQIINLFT